MTPADDAGQAVLRLELTDVGPSMNSDKFGKNPDYLILKMESLKNSTQKIKLQNPSSHSQKMQNHILFMQLSVQD
jgi:hypothetical protein